MIEDRLTPRNMTMSVSDAALEHVVQVSILLLPHIEVQTELMNRRY
jgi:hypothetical protein